MVAAEADLGFAELDGGEARDGASDECQSSGGAGQNGGGLSEEREDAGEESNATYHGLTPFTGKLTESLGLKLMSSIKAI